MNKHDIHKLKLKFIGISMVSVILVMCLLAGLIYAGNLIMTRRTIHRTLDYIVENDGELRQWNDAGNSDDDADSDSNTDNSEKPYRAARKIADRGAFDEFIDDIFKSGSMYQSPEFTFSTRYFAIIYDAAGNVNEVKANHIAAVTPEEIEEYGKIALEKNRSFGREENYYYRVDHRDDGTCIVAYLDCRDTLMSNNRLLSVAILLIGLGMIIAFILVWVLSNRAIRKEIRNAELQKQFLTNASHELKTPLAVIRANTEMQEMLGGENEWTDSTKRQIDRMNGLIGNLVMITRADENAAATAEDVDITKALNETTDTFSSMAKSNNITLENKVEDNIHMRANESQIRQLCSLLVDNAIKYCDPEGEIIVTAAQKGKGMVLTVSNSYAEGENTDYNRFFERFYRKDESHNVDKGGYGIGLSIAESLVEQYNGTISADWKKGMISFTCVLKGLK